MTDSPRYCAICDAHGDHHTDRHVEKVEEGRALAANSGKQEGPDDV